MDVSFFDSDMQIRIRLVIKVTFALFAMIQSEMAVNCLEFWILVTVTGWIACEQQKNRFNSRLPKTVQLKGNQFEKHYF